MFVFAFLHMTLHTIVVMPVQVRWCQLRGHVWEGRGGEGRGGGEMRCWCCSNKNSILD